MNDLLTQILAGLITAFIIFLVNKLSRIIKNNYKNILFVLPLLVIFYVQIIMMIYLLDKMNLKINAKSLIYLFPLSLSIFSIVQVSSYLNSLLSIVITNYKLKKHKK